MSLRLLGWVASIAAMSACGPRPSPPPPAPAADRVAIVGAERGPQGTRLVAIDEHGDRQFVLIAAASTRARDSHPAVSPDGRWLVFASSRDRALDETSLWIAPLAADAVPVRVTSGPSIESHPTWTPDGAAIVFASTRDGGDFDLWRLAIDRGHASGEPVQLTRGPGHEITPAVAPDGAVLYAAVTPRGGAEVESHLEELLPDGGIRTLSAGPADTSPAVSPDGATIAFARPVVVDGRATSELWRMERGGAHAIALTSLLLTDESGPVWSRDGRFLFATSVLRGEAGVLFSSIIHLDLRERAPVARMLRDSAGAVARLTPAIATTALDARALDGNPEYLPELARIMATAIEELRAKE